MVSLPCHSEGCVITAIFKCLFVYMQVHAHIREVCAHTSVHIYVCAHIHACACMCGMCTYVCAHIHGVYTYMCAHLCVLCAHTCMHMYVWCVHIHACTDWKSTDFLVYHPLLYPLRQSLSLNLELVFSHLDWKPASPSNLHVPGTEVTGMCGIHGLSHGCWDPTSGPHG